MDKYRLLIVDDEVSFVQLLERRLSRYGYEVMAFHSPKEALEALHSDRFDAALFDIRMPDINGLDLLAMAKEAQPAIEVVILTGHGDIETAIEAMRRGAYDYLTKPLEPAKLELTLQNAVERGRLVQKAAGLAAAQERQAGSVFIVGEARPTRHLLDLIRRVADSDATVLVMGESGTGKELVAKALHFWSTRAGQPFIPLNIGSLQFNLAESELFGHAKGAFTGAHAAKPGLVELANHGTLFLDEIGELDQSLQVKLLRFLETGEFRRVGETLTRQVKVRVVAATNRNLTDLVARGLFRMDLYYRLNVVSISVPPLRERREDIPLLVSHFLAARGHVGKRISPEALEFFGGYDFPGNIRELANIVERGALLARGPVIEKADLMCPWEGQVDSLRLNAIESEHIARMLEMVGWNKQEAAKRLGIGLRTLYRKIESYGLKPDRQNRLP